MAPRFIGTSLCLLALATPVAARDPGNCVTPASYFRNFRQGEGADTAAVEAAAYDEISVCRTAAGYLSFSLSTSGEKGGRCYVEGEAKPRQEGVFVFLDGGFRLRIELAGDRVRLSERSEPGIGRKYCTGSAAIGALELKRRSGPPLAK